MGVAESIASKAQVTLHEKKRKLAHARLAQALRWEDDVEDTDADDGSNAPKRPPEAKELFEMLFDEIEERHVTDYGVSPSCPEYTGVLALFRDTVPRAVQEATRCTRVARGMASEEELLCGDDPKRIALFKDGQRLRDILQLYESTSASVATIKRHFGDLVSESILCSARECARTIDRDNRASGMSVLFGIARPHLKLYALSAALMAFDSATGAANWHAVATLLDGIDAGTMTLAELRATFLQTYAKLGLCIFAHLTSCYLTEKVAGRFANAVKGQVLRGVLRQDTVFFDTYPSGVIQERLNHDAEDLTSKCFHLPMHMLHLFLMVISNAIAVWQIKQELFYLCLAPIPVVALAQRFFIKKMSRMHKRGRKIAEHVVANTNEVIKELRTVRSFAMESEEADHYDAQSQYRTRIMEQASIVNNCLFIAPLVMMFVGTRLLATYQGGTYVASKLITVGMAVQVGNAADHLQHCVRTFFEQLPELLKVVGPVGRICDAISARPMIEPFPGAMPKLTIPIVGHIEFVDVDFTFPSEPQKQILNKLSFIAAPGEKVAIVGGTGSGKSTVIQLVQRFYEHSTGKLLLDGRPIQDFDVHYLRRRISVVAQDNILFSTTIRENITYGLSKDDRKALSDEDVEDACRKANAWEFVCGFPRKLETFCGERGVKLSGGQKQRLAIARAIIRKPTITLLDEATSALDSKAEGVVQAALDCMIGENAQGCTLTIAHRLSTVKNCDRILCLEKGHVVEQGSHEELLDIPIQKDSRGKTIAGIYNDLWTTQMGAAKDSDRLALEAKAEAALAKRHIAKLESELSEIKREYKSFKAQKTLTIVSVKSPVSLRGGKLNHDEDDRARFDGVAVSPLRAPCRTRHGVSALEGDTCRGVAQKPEDVLCPRRAKSS